MRQPRRARADVRYLKRCAPAGGCTQWLCVAPAPPDLRVAVTMETPQDHQLGLGHDVENAVRIPTKEGSPDIAMHGRIGERIALDGLEAILERLQELVTKVVTSLPVPRVSVADVGLGGVAEPEIHFLRFSSSRT